MTAKNMRTVFFFFIFTFIISSAFGQNSKIVLTGHFQGKSLYVQNPFTSESNDFCTDSVYVNNKKAESDINVSAYEINLQDKGLKIGDSVAIIIYHKNDCIPKVLNPEVGTHKKGCVNIYSISISSKGLLYWETEKEENKFLFAIEQKRWNKWIRVGEVEGKGIPKKNSYFFPVELHSGENTIRVSHTKYTGRRCYSSKVTTRSDQQEKDYKIDLETKQITFTGSTRYEIYDHNGNIVLKGTDDKIDIKKLKKGNYYLNFDNRMEKFLLTRK